MTEVAFHFNLPDRLHYACRLLRKVVKGGNKVVVTAERAVLDELDPLLWRFAATDFVSHCFEGNDAALVSASAVLLTERPEAAPHHQVLVNLGQDVPVGFAGYERLIEVVGPADADKLGARQRWRHYADRGYDIKRHDLAAKDAS